MSHPKHPEASPRGIQPFPAAEKKLSQGGAG